MNLRYLLALTLTATVRLISGASARWLAPPPAGGQRIYFANHSSHFDAVVLWSALPPAMRMRTRPVAARDYWQSSKYRYWLATRVFNAILIDRATQTGEGSPRDAYAAFDQMVTAMGSEYSLIIFPEGTRGDGQSLRPLKGGIYHLAKRRPELEFVPVYIENLSRILPKGEFLPIPLLSSVTFGAGMKLEENETKPRFMERARKALEGLMGDH